MKTWTPCQVNSSGQIFGSTDGSFIYVVGATANFVANNTTVNVNSNSVNLSFPLLVTGNITGCTTGTVFYFRA